MPDHAVTLARRCAGFLWAEDEAARDLGMVLKAVGPGAASVAMVVTPAMVNGYDICHGGYVYLLASTTLSIACQSRNHRAVAQSCQITFLAASRRGTQLQATAREHYAGARSAIYDVTVATSTGEIIAEFRGHARRTSGDLVVDGE